MVLFTLMLPTLLLPLAGLAIDASIARLMQIRLQAAVDGAALGAGRLLGTGAVTETVAGEFLSANFRTDGSAGTWNVSNLQSNIVYTPGITKRIDISATASVPLLFLRIFGVSSASIAANGSATRSDSRVVFVIDRSGSMNTDDGSGKSTVIADAINETTILVKRFIEGTDELGLVVFDGSAVVGYPTYCRRRLDARHQPGIHRRPEQDLLRRHRQRHGAPSCGHHGKQRHGDGGSALHRLYRAPKGAHERLGRPGQQWRRHPAELDRAADGRTSNGDLAVFEQPRQQQRE